MGNNTIQGPRINQTTGAVEMKKPGNGAAPDGPGELYQVQSGDSLYKIAQNKLGDGERWRDIAQLNPQLQDPNKIFPGDALRLPELRTAPLGEQVVQQRTGMADQQAVVENFAQHKGPSAELPRKSGVLNLLSKKEPSLEQKPDQESKAQLDQKSGPGPQVEQRIEKHPEIAQQNEVVQKVEQRLEQRTEVEQRIEKKPQIEQKIDLDQRKVPDEPPDRRIDAPDDPEWDYDLDDPEDPDGPSEVDIPDRPDFPEVPDRPHVPETPDLPHQPEPPEDIPHWPVETPGDVDEPEPPVWTWPGGGEPPFEPPVRPEPPVHTTPENPPGRVPNRPVDPHPPVVVQPEDPPGHVPNWPTDPYPPVVTTPPVVTRPVDPSPGRVPRRQPDPTPPVVTRPVDPSPGRVPRRQPDPTPPVVTRPVDPSPGRVPRRQPDPTPPVVTRPVDPSPGRVPRRQPDPTPPVVNRPVTPNRVPRQPNVVQPNRSPTTGNGTNPPLNVPPRRFPTDG